MKFLENQAVESAKELIKQGSASCVIIKNAEIVHADCSRGIKPMISVYEQGLLENAIVVDKIIGKAAASIIVLGKAEACFGLTMSLAAIDYLKKHGIEVGFYESVEHIINRTGDDICPMEKTVKDIDDPKDAVIALKNKIKILSANKS